MNFTHTNTNIQALKSFLIEYIAVTSPIHFHKYQDHVHLITCGSEHISKNPLYNYINAPVGCFGIADESSDMPGAEIRRVKPWKLLIRKVFRGFNS